jgi:DsbC/DsbD-like thiol-disulfide interchange protein
MSIGSSRIIAIAALIGGSWLSLGEGIANAEAESLPVTVNLIAERSAIARDEKFTLGVHFRIAPGWHIYWRNPGEAGKPTSVSFEPADGFSAGDVRWPAPQEFFQSQGGGATDAGLKGYGYADEVVLFGDMTPLPNVQNGARLSFGAKVHWLACDKSRCVPGSADPTVTLSVRVLTAAERDGQNSLLMKYSSLLPESLETSSFVKSYQQHGITSEKGDSNHEGGITSMLTLDWAEKIEPIMLAAYRDDFYFMKTSRIKTLGQSSDVAALFESGIANAPANRIVYAVLVFKTGSGEQRALELPFSVLR